MKKYIFCSALIALTCTAKADWGLNTNLWLILTPFSDSQMTINNNNATFLNRGILVSQQSFPTDLQISGSFEFTGNTSDMFQIDLRTDGSLLSPADNWANGVYIGFGGDEAGLNSANNVKIQGSDTAAYANFTFTPNTFYNFEIIDDGNNINLYLNNLVSPILTFSDSEIDGSQIAMENSRGTAGGGNEGEELGIVLNNFLVTPAPEPTELSLFGLSILGIYLKRNLKK